MSAPGSRRGTLLVLTGPSGVGKTTVAEHLLADPAFGRAVTATTRAPRPGEADGIAYHFLLVPEFEARVARGEFLEHANVYGRLYGTPVASVRAVLDSGRVCVLVIDVQGATAIQDLRATGGLPFDVVTVFLLPPDEAEWLRRLSGRSTESPAELAARVQAGTSTELPRAGSFDHRVVNRNLDQAVVQIRKLVSGRRA